MISDALSSLLDRAALRQTADIYALGADRRDTALWRQVLTDECVIEGPGFTSEGLENCLQAIDALGRMFRATQHRVHQQVVTIDGALATGETYCTAAHLLRDRDAVLVWTLRYQDAWRRDGANWRFTRRQLILDWSETCAIEVGTAGAGARTLAVQIDFS